VFILKALKVLCFATLLQVFILKEVKVVCFDTLLQVLISKAVSSRQFTVDSFRKPLRKAGTGLGTEVLCPCESAGDRADVG